MDRKVQIFWDFAAKKYDKIEGRLENIFNKIHSNIKRHVKQSDVVLDFACGTGTSSLEIADKVRQIDAIDISSTMLEIAAEKAAEKNKANINFIHADIYDEKLANESYDIVIAIGILHLLADDQQTIRRIKELLKPGGVFISSTPCLAEKMTFSYKLQFLPAYFISKLRLLPQVLRKYRSMDIEKLLYSENFQIVESEKIFDKMTAYFVVSRK